MPKGMPIATALQELGLDNTATEAEVKQAYKDLARIWHPDRFQDDERMGARTEAKIKQINEAKTVAMTYLKKYGHFRFVGRERQQESRRGPEPEAPPEAKEAPPEETKADPEKETPPESEPEYREPEVRHYRDSSSPRHNTLIVVVLLVTFGSFLYMLGSSVLVSPEERFKTYTKKLEVKKFESAQVRENKLRQQKAAPALKEKNEPEETTIDTFFTLGSDKSWVSEVQGAPLKIEGLEWRYGFSTVQFERGLVVGWNSSELNPLKTGMLMDTSQIDSFYYFGIGSSPTDVIALAGTPTIIEGGVWKYDEASVKFEADTVVSWENDIKNSLNID